MHKIVERLKSGREFQFRCKEYSIKTFKQDGSLAEFTYEGGVGECPLYFQVSDIEAISIIREEQKNDERN